MILLFGLPGAGKSKQAELLAKANGWQWLSTGQIFRDSRDQEVQRLLAAGILIDDETTNKVVAGALSTVPAGNQAILDGYPRNVSQAAWLMDHGPSFGQTIDCAIELQVPKGESAKRLAGRQRVEDNTEVISDRQNLYDQTTKPLLDFLRTKGYAVHELSGLGSAEEVNVCIQKVIDTCLAK